MTTKPEVVRGDRGQRLLFAVCDTFDLSPSVPANFQFNHGVQSVVDAGQLLWEPVSLEVGDVVTGTGDFNLFTVPDYQLWRVKTVQVLQSSGSWGIDGIGFTVYDDDGTPNTVLTHLEASPTTEIVFHSGGGLGVPIWGGDKIYTRVDNHSTDGVIVGRVHFERLILAPTEKRSITA